MASKSSSLQVGDRAPEFMLPAANLPQAISLKTLLESAPVIVEFLRGTW